MHPSKRPSRRAVVTLAFAMAALLSAQPAAAKDVALCHTGKIKLLDFDKHVKVLRGMNGRYPEEVVDELVAQQKKGGPDFFSSQIVIQEQQSGSGTYDLRNLHGINTAKQYTNLTRWTCEADDYPIVYFVGFRVRGFSDGAILVAREPGTVNILPLREIDPELKKRTKVTMQDSGKVLCDDIAASCINGIFHDRQ